MMIDFSVSSPLLDATLVVEGWRIHVGKDFLSIHSPFFMALFHGGFAEGNKGEIELKDVKYDEFLSLLQWLYDPNGKIEEVRRENPDGEQDIIEIVGIESLFRLADRFDLKCVSDCLEQVLIPQVWEDDYCWKLLYVLSDRYQLLGLQAKLYTRIDCYFDDKNEEEIKRVFQGDKYSISEGAARAILAAADENIYPYFEKSFELNPKPVCSILREVEKIDEPETGFTGTGEFAVYLPRCSGCVFLGGLIWSVDTFEEKDENGEKYLTPYLIVNRGYQSNVEWSAEGFVSVEYTKTSLSNGREEERETTMYSFSFNNSDRVGGMMRKKDCKMSSGFLHHARVQIFLTAVSGIRKGLSFEFDAPADLSDGIFVVEGRKIHVNKQYLYTISIKFRELFEGKDEVELKNVKYKELVEFLHWVYPSCKKTLTVDAMFDTLRVAQEIGVDDMNTSMMDFYWRLNVPFTHFFPEKLIFDFQFDKKFDLSGMERLEDPLSIIPHYWTARREKKWSAVFPLLMRCTLLSKMTKEKKLELYEWMARVEYQH